MQRKASARGVWHFFPWFIAGGMALVVAVNVGMAYTALHTFPGNAGGDGFDLSNHYDAVIEHMRRQSALGWDARADTDAAGRPFVLLTNRSGEPLTGAGVEATARRVLGFEQNTDLRFREIAPGRYVGSSVLGQKGQWELQLSASAGGHEFSTTRRILVR